jgi:2,5-diketo-D-gluconate reductase A
MSTLPQLFLPLNDGVDIPQIGVVSFRNDSIDTTRELIINRVDAGFRHIEVSELFGNGHLILESVVEEAEIPRENLFVTLKIWPNKRRKQELIDACKSTLASIGLEYVDLCIIHAPLAISKLIDQWRGLEFLKQEGYVKSIGVGKVTHTQLSDVIKNCSILPAVVEVSSKIQKYSN